jgi:hypothetical protein
MRRLAASLSVTVPIALLQGGCMNMQQAEEAQQRDALKLERQNTNYPPEPVH